MDKIVIITKNIEEFTFISSDFELLFASSLDELINYDNYEVIIFDVYCFDSDEIESFRSFFESKNLPLILILPSDFDLEYFRECAVYSFIEKPFNRELAVKVIQRALKCIERQMFLEKFINKLADIKENVIFSSISEHIVFQDPSHRIIWANKAAGDSLGVDSKELIGKYCYELWHKRKDPCEHCPVADAMKYREYREYEVFTKHDKRWWLIKGFPVIEDGKLIGAVEMTQDITEKKRLREALEEEREKMSFIMERTLDVIYSYRFKPEIKFIYITPSCEKLTGYSPDEFYSDGSIVYKIIHPEDQRLLKHMLDSGEIFEKPVVVRLFKKNGEVVWIEQNNRPIYENNEPVGVIGVARDITMRKTYEKEILKKERFLSALISNIPGMVYIRKDDENWTLSYVSEGAKDLLGLNPDDINSTSNFSYLSIISPGDKERLIQEIKSALSEMVPFEIEYRISTLNGEEKWVREKGRGIYEGGRLLYIQGYIYDITHYKDIQSKLESLISEKEFYLKELQHRVKNSFGIVLSLIDIESFSTTEENLKMVLEDLRKRIFSISSIYDLLFYSGGIKSIPLCKYLKKILEHMKSSFNKLTDAEIECIMNTEVELPLKKAISIGLIFNEILTNILKYSFPEGYDRPYIKIELHIDNNGSLTLNLFDNGVSFPENIGEKEGFGFKLINTLVNDLKGTLELENVKGGKNFKVVIPMD